MDWKAPRLNRSPCCHTAAPCLCPARIHEDGVLPSGPPVGFKTRPVQSDRPLLAAKTEGRRWVLYDIRVSPRSRARGRRCRLASPLPFPFLQFGDHPRRRFAQGRLRTNGNHRRIMQIGTMSRPIGCAHRPIRCEFASPGMASDGASPTGPRSEYRAARGRPPGPTSQRNYRKRLL